MNKTAYLFTHDLNLDTPYECVKLLCTHQCDPDEKPGQNVSDADAFHVLLVFVKIKESKSV